MTWAPIISVQEVEAFLEAHHGEPIAHLEPLSGGFWSLAFGYRVGTHELVIRFGADRHAYEADRAATALNAHHIPVPSVLDIGEAFGGVYAISARYFGRFLETVGPEEASTTGPLLLRLLEALFHTPLEVSAPIARASRPVRSIYPGASGWPLGLLTTLGALSLGGGHCLQRMQTSTVSTRPVNVASWTSWTPALSVAT